MAIIQKINKPFSENKKGIRSSKTKRVLINGVTYEGVVTKIEIDILKNQLKVYAIIKSYDNQGNLIGGSGVTQPRVFIVKDIPETGTVEIDSEGKEIEGTYKKISDESLAITGWDSQLGASIIPSAVTFLEEQEGWSE